MSMALCEPHELLFLVDNVGGRSLFAEGTFINKALDRGFIGDRIGLRVPLHPRKFGQCVF